MPTARPYHAAAVMAAAVMTAAATAAPAHILGATSVFAAPAAHAAPADGKSGGGVRTLPAMDYDEVEKRMEEATEKAAGDGVTLGMALYDRATGTMVSNSLGKDPFPLASVAKAFIAETVGYTNYTPPEDGDIKAGEGEMEPAATHDAILRDASMRLSDNEATDALWAEYGRTGIIGSVKKRYGLSDATQERSFWAGTTSSAEDLATFFAGVLDGTGGMSEEQTEYFVRLMYSLPRYSYGQADQDFGIRAGLPKELVGQKGGWDDPLIRNSAGFFGEDQRFTMAVLTKGDTSLEAATRAVEHVFPDGQAVPHLEGPALLDDPASADDGEDVTAAGSTMPLAGGGGPSTAALAGIGLIVVLAAFGLGWALRGTRSS